MVVKPTGRVVCDCEKFKETRLCSHSIAASERNGQLAQHLQWFKKAEQPNLLEELPAVLGTNPQQKDLVADTEIPHSIAIDGSPRVERTTI